MSLDETDYKIISVLQEDSSQTYRELARRLSMNESTVRKRVIALKKRGLRFTIIVDTSKLGFKTDASLGVDVDPSKLLDVGRQLARLPGLRMVYTASGEHDFQVVVWASDRDALAKVVDRISAIDGVLKVRVSVVAERLK